MDAHRRPLSTLPRCLAFSIAALAAACARAGPAARTAPRSSSDVLTQAQIESSSARNAYDAVQWLCPPRVRSSMNQRGIFVDGVRLSTPSMLQGVPTDAIREIRWLDARDAVIRYGSVNPEGVILVSTKPPA